MILQTNVFVCEGCGRIVSISEEVEIYTDPVVNPPKDWSLDDFDKLICDECKVK